MKCDPRNKQWAAESPAATIAAVKHAMATGLKDIFDESNDYPYILDRSKGWNGPRMQKGNVLILHLVQLDPRGGFYAQSTVTDALKEIQEEQKSKHK